MKKRSLPFIFLALVFALAFVACSKEDAKENDPLPEQPEVPKDSVVTYTDLKFSTTPGHPEYGRVFSSYTGLVYTDDAIPDSVSKYVDLAFIYYGDAAMLFTSADSPDFDLTIDGATTSHITNLVNEEMFDVSEFDTLSHATTLRNLEINQDEESFDATALPLAVLFRNGRGKKGVVKVKAVMEDYIIVDVKVEY